MEFPGIKFSGDELIDIYVRGTANGVVMAVPYVVYVIKCELRTKQIKEMVKARNYIQQLMLLLLTGWVTNSLYVR